MPTFKIDGKEITVEPGTTILQAALANGIEIPHYCYHPALKIAGSCRLCLVEIDNNPKLQLSCATEVRDGMEVRTQTEQVKQARRSMLEFFLINHPLDCPICDKAGECLLQDYTYQYGSSHSRMVEEKRVRPTKDLGGNILLYRNRCVLCTRCVRFFTDIVGEPYLMVEHRGYHSDISIFPGRGLTHKMSGNVVEICPVGCLIDKDFLFHARVWNLNKTKSICSACSSGCNIWLEHKGNKIYRIRSRHNPAVNDHWICDDGRYFYHRLQQTPRLLEPQAGKNTLDWEQALNRAAEQLKKWHQSGNMGQVGVVGSAFATVEENYLLRRLFADELGVTQFFVYAPPVQGEDIVYKSGFTIRADKSPNRLGATMILGEKENFWQAIKKGSVKSLIFLCGDIHLQITDEQKRLLAELESLWVMDIALNELSALAHLLWPIAFPEEKQGCYVNVQGRLQRFDAALTPPAQVRPAWQILLALWKKINPKITLATPADIMEDMATKLKVFKEASYFKIGDMGVALKKIV